MNKRRAAWLLAVLAILAVLGVLAFKAGDERARHAPENTDSAIAALSANSDTAGFSRAEQPRAFEFPRDHAAHPDFRSEWWYFTGHLRDERGRPYGFQLTLFRFELAAERTSSVSAWRTPTVLLGHFALTDIAGGKFHAFERMSRALPSVAGTALSPPAVWLDEWRIEQHGDHDWRLSAQQDGIALNLDLSAASAVVLQGEAGLSRKSAAAGNASYYYSMPRLRAAGTLSLADGKHAVEGEAWLDREWSTSALAREQAGWDWFALQLADGGSLMFYRLRQRDGSSDAYSAGTYVDADGQVHALGARDVTISARDHWTSPHSGRVYPHGWRLEVPSAKLTLDLAPRLADQEWRGRFRYWEGAVTVSRDGQAAGLGYVELTGY